jgi:hypothetical protein
MVSIDAEYLMRILSVIYLISSRSKTVILIENIVRIYNLGDYNILSQLTGESALMITSDKRKLQADIVDWKKMNRN